MIFIFSHKAKPWESWAKSFTVRPRKDTHGVTYNNTIVVHCVCLLNPPIIYLYSLLPCIQYTISNLIKIVFIVCMSMCTLNKKEWWREQGSAARHCVCVWPTPTEGTFVVLLLGWFSRTRFEITLLRGTVLEIHEIKKSWR